tara:strand:+ start:1745 stop:1879 length:135 start_codon:yes stop_codon:yes gene_type:complete
MPSLPDKQTKVALALMAVITGDWFDKIAIFNLLISTFESRLNKR